MLIKDEIYKQNEIIEIKWSKFYYVTTDREILI